MGKPVQPGSRPRPIVRTLVAEAIGVLVGVGFFALVAPPQSGAAWLVLTLGLGVTAMASLIAFFVLPLRIH